MNDVVLPPLITPEISRGPALDMPITADYVGQ
jgi:hypothetical protein